MVYNKLMLSSGVFRVFLLRDGFSCTIKTTRLFRKSAYISTTLLSLIALAILFPISFKSTTPAEATDKPASPSTLTYSASSSIANVSLDVNSSSGSFATSSSNVSFGIITNNASGYTLSLKTSGANYTLGGIIDTLSSVRTANDFELNKWGILPSKVNSSNNTTNYYPASSIITMDTTNSSNSTINNYTVGIGIKADYNVQPGTYTNTTLVVEYVANPVTYSVNYYANTPDTTVVGMPSINPQTGIIPNPTINDHSITLASAPTRTGYTFLGWCAGAAPGVSNIINPSTTSNITTSNGLDTCNGTIYNDGQSFGINTTGNNSNTYLYAIWSVNSYTCTKQYRLQNADGSWGDYIMDGTEQINYGSICTYSKSIADYKNTTSGTNNTQASASSVMGVSGLTFYLDLYRNTYTLDIDRNTTYIQSASATTTPVHGSNYYRWGQTVDITAVPTSNGVFAGWTQSGTAGAFDNISSTSTTFAMGKGNTTVTANGKKLLINLGYMQDMTLTTCSQATNDSYVATDRRDGKDYSIRYINGSCWMTQNLGITGIISSADSNFTSISSFNVSQYDLSNAAYCKHSSGYDLGRANVCSHDSGDAIIGAWYNYAAVSIGIIAGDKVTSALETPTSEDICPKNWHLPTGPSTTNNTELNILVGNNTSGYQTPTAGLIAFNAITGGRYYDGSLTSATYGYWWSASSSNSSFYRHTLSFYNGNFNGYSTSGREYGNFVRCVLTDSTATLSNYTYMQDVTPNQARNLANGASVTLTDRRDGQNYTIAKFGGALWMTRNLAIGCNGSGSTYGSSVSQKTLSSSDTNISSGTWKTPTTSLTAGGSYTNPYMTCSSTYGAWYNYAAATAGTITGSSNTTEDIYNICPSGWTLPETEHYPGSFSNVATNRMYFNPVTGGYYASGQLTETSKARWWTTTPAATETNRKIGIWDGSNYTSNSGARGYGSYVRCIYNF